MEIINKNGLERLETFFKKSETLNYFEMGFAKIEPNKGQEIKYSVHEYDEYSYVIKGSVHGECDGKPFLIHEGQASFIKAGERHYSINDGDSDCEVVWVFIK